MPARDARLLVIDRDGTLSRDPEDFVRDPQDWQPLPGAPEALARLNEAGWRIVVATNQPGLGRGVFDLATLNAVHAQMHRLLAQAGARVEAVFFCPHAPDEECDCRKPAPGMLRDIARRRGLAPTQLVMVGDSLRDVQAGLAAGCETHLVLTGQSVHWRGAPRPPELPPSVAVHDDLAALADALLSRDEPEGVRP
ncbi:D-glycero-beta-D-manno-heptose 1,7-bisphosphate 7-phosphatase [Tepidimonas aquatica]|uniref:D,D-heptose 1,7-bisphosphate phosphatase n=1 Tax=Tepidimonas aquatica TaxID=247482 RepID=A0A554WL04_9BURK|nr:D-glycero-beta-D-manno-heptose 1,7-bisphosphate 7-phosphatase [Tepidimonas aquatica]TSE24272.1 D-glycero-beta-D-manno-heptose-1,7-bisphosphate 7-phosphatase [Tepidimonas aquatica]